MYCTVLDVKNALAPAGQGQGQGTALALTDVQLIDAINEADSVIRAYVGMIYIVPQVDTPVIPPTTPESYWSVAPEPVRYWSRDIAAYLATLTFKRNQDVPQDDPVRLRLNLAMQQLVMIRDGKSTLPFPPYVPPEGAESGVTVVNQYEGTLFGPADFGLVPVAAISGFGIWPGGPC